MSLRASTEIQAPPATVWAVIRDLERWPEWTPTVSSIRRLDGGPLAPGSRALIRQPKFPPATWRVTEVVEGRALASVTGGPGLRVFARQEVEPHGGGSRATFTIAFSGVLGRVVDRLTRAINERYLRIEIDGLKERCEQIARTRTPAAAGVPKP